MKKNLLFTCLVFLVSFVSTQQIIAQGKVKIDPEKLSEQGRILYVRIETLKSNDVFFFSQLNDDHAHNRIYGDGLKVYEEVIQMYEKITETDPYYAPVYYELGALCTALGELKGEPYLTKARINLQKYESLKDATTINQNNANNEGVHQSILGTWTGISEDNGACEKRDSISIINDNGNIVVRMKIKVRYKDGRSEVVWRFNNNETIQANGKTIKWRVERGINDYYYNFYVNGRYVTYSKDYCLYTATLAGGVLKCEMESMADGYDSYSQFVTKIYGGTYKYTCYKVNND